jgi:hypothetical protein
MRLSFQHRILLILICLGAVPTALAILGWGLTIRPPRGPLAPVTPSVGKSFNRLRHDLHLSSVLDRLADLCLRRCGRSRPDRLLPAQR